LDRGSGGLAHAVAEPRELPVLRHLDKLQLLSAQPPRQKRRPAAERDRRDADEDLVE
jgi:hypothetical protein